MPYTIEDIKKYSINLLWISRKKDPGQKYIYPGEEEIMVSKLFQPAIKWAKENPEAVVNIWFDSELYKMESIKNTDELLQSIAREAGCDNIRLRSIQDIPIVQQESAFFSEESPLYLRIDWLKLIICLYSITSEFPDDAAIFSDLEVGDRRLDEKRMSKQELFDKESLDALDEIGIQLSWSVGHIENQFIQVLRNAATITSLEYTINASLMRAKLICDGSISEELNNACRTLESIFHIVYHATKKEVAILYCAIKSGDGIKINKQFLETGKSGEWIDYDPDRHGYEPLGTVLSLRSEQFCSFKNELTGPKFIERDLFLDVGLKKKYTYRTYTIYNYYIDEILRKIGRDTDTRAGGGHVNIIESPLNVGPVRPITYCFSENKSVSDSVGQESVPEINIPQPKLSNVSSGF